eukprot:scaffold7595_cov267-Pinguiococcus_pyrenoidosus.AAC.17
MVFVLAGGLHLLAFSIQARPCPTVTKRFASLPLAVCGFPTRPCVARLNKSFAPAADAAGVLRPPLFPTPLPCTRHQEVRSAARRDLQERRRLTAPTSAAKGSGPGSPPKLGYLSDAQSTAVAR